MERANIISNKYCTLLLVFLLSLAGCNDQEKTSDQVANLDSEVSDQAADLDLEVELQDLVDRTLRGRSDDTENPVYGAVLHVRSPKHGIEWSGAAGTTDDSKAVPITPEHPFRIASNTKTFVAVAILRLWEEGRLNLDTSISEYISDLHNQMLLDDGYDLANISPRHLMAQTSGLFDYADSKTFEKQFTSNPNRRWSRTDQLAAAMEWGDAYGQPGEVYRYSDTGYILLGEIIERVSGESLGTALKQLINYEKIGLTSTWLETLEPKPSGVPTRAHQYLGKVDFFDHDPSFDLYGGGGLVSTVADLARFNRAIFNGEVFENTATIDTLLSTVDVQRGGPIAYGAFKQVPGTYGLGVQISEVAGRIVYGHAGYFGTYVGYVPSLDLVISLVLTQHYVRDEKKQMFYDALELVSNAVGGEKGVKSQVSASSE